MDFDYFRDMLNKQKEEILYEAYKILNKQVNSQKEGMPDTIDRAALETDRSIDYRLKDRERKLLKKVEEAIERIDIKTYGLCKGCACYIDENRLKVKPFATLCVECREERETEEKQKKLKV